MYFKLMKLELDELVYNYLLGHTMGHELLYDYLLGHTMGHELLYDYLLRHVVAKNRFVIIFAFKFVCFTYSRILF